MDKPSMSMGFSTKRNALLLCLLLSTLMGLSTIEGALFGDNFQVVWGNVKMLQGGQLAQLTMDKTSGSGFESKNEYIFGSTSMRIKLVGGNSAGTVTAFYMTSQGAAHDEIDFEFLGNLPGKPVTLQTNIFANGQGNREQRIKLWFDPSQEFHNYSILWNQQQIALFVDSIPIRVFRNNEKVGVPYPKTKPMRLLSTLWNGEDWATNGGKTKRDWTQAPFVASYELFDIQGCASSSSSSCSGNGAATNKWWDSSALESLDRDQLSKLRWVKKNYMTYDYCADKARFPSTPPECALNP